MSIAYGGVIAFLFRCLNVAIALGTVLVASHELGANRYGTFVLGVTVVGVVSAMTGGLTAASAYQVTNQRRDPADVLASSGSLALGLSLVAIAAGVLAEGVAGGRNGQIAAEVALAAAAVILNSVLAGILLGREAFLRYNVALVGPPLLAFLAVVVLLAGPWADTPEGALAAYAIGQWAALPFVYLLTNGARRPRLRPSRGLMRAVAAFSVLAAASSGVSYLNYRADLFVVEHFERAEGVAVYSIAVYIAESVWQLSGSLALAAYARLGAVTPHEAAELAARIMRHTLVLLGSACLVLFAVAGLLVNFILPDGFGETAGALRILLPGTLAYGLAAALSGFYTYQKGRPWAAAIIAGTSLLIDVALAIVLVPRLGVDGAALATTLSYLIAIAAGMFVFLRQTRLGLRILRFGRADIEDYRSLFGRLRSAAGR